MIDLLFCFLLLVMGLLTGGSLSKGSRILCFLFCTGNCGEVEREGKGVLEADI